MALDHLLVGRFQISGEARGVEQRVRVAIAREPFSNSSKRGRIVGELKCAGLVVSERGHHHIRQADRMEQARRHAARKTVAKTCEHRKSRPQRIGRTRVRAARERVEK